MHYTQWILIHSGQKLGQATTVQKVSCQWERIDLLKSVKVFNMRILCDKKSSIGEVFFPPRMFLINRRAPYGVEGVSELQISF